MRRMTRRRTTRIEPNGDEPPNNWSQTQTFKVMKIRNVKAKELQMAKEILVRKIELRLKRGEFLDNRLIPAARLLVKEQFTAVRTGHIGRGADTASADAECHTLTGDGQLRTASLARAESLRSAWTTAFWD